jgi:hypothetical protein
MNNTVLIAVIGASGSGLVAITALLLDYRGFASLDARMLALEFRVDGRLESLRSDMGELNKTMTSTSKRNDVVITVPVRQNLHTHGEGRVTTGTRSYKQICSVQMSGFAPACSVAVGWRIPGRA